MFGSHNQKSMGQADGSHISEEVRITGVISASKPLILFGQVDGNIDAVVGTHQLLNKNHKVRL